MDVEKKYHTIGEVAEQLGVSASLIRFWESQFDEIKPRKNKNGNRQYTQQEIERLRTVYFLVKEKGYTLAGAKDVLKNQGAKADALAQVQALEKIKAFFLHIKENL